MYIAYIDLDDTLLNKEKRISDYTKDILISFQEQGNILVLATARSKQLKGLPDNIKNITPYFIFHNGGEIVCNGVIVYQNYFNVQQTERIGSYLTEHGVKAAVILDENYYANYDAVSVWGEIKNFHYTDFSGIDFCAPKFSILLDSESQVEVLNTLKDYTQTTYIDNYSGAIVAPKGVSKGVAVSFLQKNYFYKCKSIFIGNDFNDISGFDSCDIKIAVANAEKSLLKMADIIIGSNQDDGVAYYLDSLLK